jgi:hypothetical protein
MKTKFDIYMEAIQNSLNGKRVFSETTVGPTETPAVGSGVLFLQEDKAKFMKFFNYHIEDKVAGEYKKYVPKILPHYFEIFKNFKNNQNYSISDLNYITGSAYVAKIEKYMDANNSSVQVDSDYLGTIANHVRTLDAIARAIRFYVQEQSRKPNSPLRTIFKRNDEALPSNNANPSTKKEEEADTELSFRNVKFPESSQSADFSLVEKYLETTKNNLLLKALQENKK